MEASDEDKAQVEAGIRFFAAAQASGVVLAVLGRA